MRRLFVFATLAAAAALGGCAVVSDKPLFDPSSPPSARLAEGLWAFHGPGCEVRPNPAGVLPDCAMATHVTAHRIRWDAQKTLDSVMSFGAGKVPPLPMPAATDYVVADGDPVIFEMVNGATFEQTPGTPDLQPGKPHPPSYMALKVLHRAVDGRIDRGIVWNIFCPKDLAHTPGFKSDVGRCVVLDEGALRAQARVVPPLFSFYFTWVAPEPR